MANQIYGYNPTYGGGAALYHPRTVTEPYVPDSSNMNNSRFLTSNGLSGTDSSYYVGMDGGYQNDGYGYPDSGISGLGGFSASRAAMGGAAVPSSTAHWSGVDVETSFDPVMAGVKRSHEAFYHQSYMGNNNSFGQSEALFSANTLGKRPRFESAITLPIYPQRPGEKDCAHYMLTRTCKFGDSCKFDHPVWVPEGGLPDWKEVPLIATSEALPERPGAPDCPYFLKTQNCKFGIRCKFNHPKDRTEFLVVSGAVDVPVMPERPSEPPCAFYIKTGKCKFGATCKFHHPKDIQVPVAVKENGYADKIESIGLEDGKTISGDARPVKPFVPFTPALVHNSKGLPVRPGEVDCPFYLKTGSCKYGATCRYNHPDRNDFCAAINPAIAANYIMTSPAANMNIGVVNTAGSIHPTIDPRLAQTALGLGSTSYPQRPGQIECDFYMKTGECKFGERCKFHHPMDRAASTPSTTVQVLQQNVKLTLAGLPRREGSIICPFYMKTGTCKYGITCRFDHPPPAEAIAMATIQGTSASVGGDGEEKGTEAIQEHQL